MRREASGFVVVGCLEFGPFLEVGGWNVEFFPVTRLCGRGILVKNVSGSHPLLAGCLRVTVGTPQENDAFLQALGALL